LLSIRAPAFTNAHKVTRVDRELVITLPLPEDLVRRVAGRPRGTRYPPDHRARALGPRLREFRARHGLIQEEVAVVGADRSAVAQWERGATIHEGVLREELAQILDGRRWPQLRATMLGPDGDGLPVTWSRAVRWYRRASRERRPRETIGASCRRGHCTRTIANAIGTGCGPSSRVTGSASSRRICVGSRTLPTACAG
jgi:transcriptional regulator with XRE-family HTH domain